MPNRKHLEFACPHCKAAPGQTCRNYDGRGGAPHRERLALTYPPKPAPEPKPAPTPEPITLDLFNR